MSNPFAVFRKNQTAWMAGLVLLSLLAFVVAPAIEQASRSFRGGTGEDAVFVRWDRGKITIADLQSNMEKHGNLVRFLSRLAEAVVEAGGQPRVPGFAYNPETREIVGLGIQTNTTEMDVCRTRILASEAERLGIAFDEQAVGSFIRDFCDRRITDEQLAKILQESTNGRLSSFDLQELLKRELSALVVGQLARSGVYAQPPGKTYRDFKKLNQTAKVAAFPIFVADYVDQVSGDPTEAEIQRIYDAGAGLPADPNSPIPGFGRRYQADIEYVEADLAAWTERFKANITEEQLRTEYEQRIALGQLKTPIETESGEAETSEAESGSSESETGETETSASEVSEPAAGEGAPPVSEVPATEPAGDGEAAISEPADAPPSGDQSLRIRNDSGVRLVAFVQDDAPPPVVQPPQLGQGTESAASATAAESTESKPSTESSSAGDTSAVNTAAETENPSAEPGVTEPAATTQEAATQEAATGDEVELPEALPTTRDMTFEEAREQLVLQLAREAASPAMNAAMTTLVDKHMRPYYGTYRKYAAMRDSELPAEDDADKPQAPDIKKIATDLGLKYVKTGLVDGVKLAQTNYGVGNISSELGQSGSVADTMMSPQMELYQPITSTYIDQSSFMSGGNIVFLQHISWKVEERQAYVPTLQEVRQEVVEAWKQQQARQLAAAAADALAKKVGTGDSAWSNALSTSEQALVVQSDSFSWMTQYGEYTFPSPVAKLDPVGDQFMQAVFSAKPDEVIAAPNRPQDVYWVTRVLEFGPAEEDLRTRFEADPMKSGPMTIARQEIDNYVRDWYLNLEQELNVQWTANQLY